MITRSLRENSGGVVPVYTVAVVPPATSEAWSRRGFLKATGGAVGLLLAFQFTGRPARAATPAATPKTGEFSPNAFLRIAPDGAVTVIINHSEMGQGVSTALPMLIAEELDADWTRVRTEFAPVDASYNHAMFGIQMTGGSTSTWSEFERLRMAGATARALLLQAAAKEWNGKVEDCHTERGVVIHASGKRLDYGALASRAAQLTPPEKVALKDAKDFRLIGKPTPRIDSRAKVTGAAEFGLDVRRPNGLVAMVVRAPTFGGQVETVNDAAARAIPGVKAVVRVPTGVAVIATDTWVAKQARDVLAPQVSWKLLPAAQIDSVAQAASFAQQARQPGKEAEAKGDVEAALRSAAKTVEADYQFPYLAHAPMEPLNATVELGADRATVWTGTQFQTVDRAHVAEVLGFKPEQVTLHTTYLGGGFGRRATAPSDWVTEAAHVAKAARAAGISAPIKTVWTREDDLAGGYYRPMFHHRLLGGIDAAGKVVAWQQTLVGQSFIFGSPFEQAIVKNGIDETSVEGAAHAPYQVPARRVDVHYPTLPVPTLWWRSVGHTHTAVAVECFIDELAHAGSRDPVELRRELLPPDSRERRVLDLAVEKSGYGRTKLPAGHAHGVAVHESFGSFVAQVAEVSMQDDWPRVHRITAAVDCGTVVNPMTVEAQIQGGIVFALSALFYGEITLKDGRVEQQNFHQYRVLRMNEAPKVDVHVIARGDKMGGIGETGVPPTFAAVLNAMFAVNGRRVRSLPLSRSTAA
jgi:isoquinoline 1-oxidoreductase beta subunit